jgi:hypothetical protein
MATIQDLVFNPQRFFSEKMTEEESLRTPLVIVLLIGIIGGISALFVSGLTLQLLPPEAQSFGSVIQIISVAGGILGAFVMWLVWTVAFFIISSILGGSGTFRRTLEFVGYGSFPQIFGGIISGIIFYYYLSGITVPAVTDPQQIQEVITGLLTAPMMQFAILVGILFILWSANLWIFGMMEGRRLSMKNAIITVGVPVVIYLVYSAINLV